MSLLMQVKERLELFKNLYDTLRIVDPVSKKVLHTDGGHKDGREEYCYCIWNEEGPCKNCVTIRSYLENDTIVKLESKIGKVFIHISTPISIDNTTYIVEMIKDITDTGSLKNENIVNPYSAGELISKINEKIITDALTGIYNRRYINERLILDVNKSIAQKQPLSIIMADIDYFKDVNDTYGHIIGDKVLKDFASLLKKSIRKDMDWVGRYGGEEFLIVLNNTNSEDAFRTAENIRMLIESTDFRYDNFIIHVTASFGVCSAYKDELDVEELISNADSNLYKAKNSGKNKTFINQ